MKIKRYFKLIVACLMFFMIGCSSSINSAKNNSDFKIISLAPSNTEILVSLGLSDNLVGIDSYSKDIEGISGDVKVFETFDPSIEGILELDPNLLVVFGDQTLYEKYLKVKELGVEVLVIESASDLDDIYESIGDIAEATKREIEGENFIKQLKKEVEDIENLSKNDRDIRVYFEISPPPSIFTFGNDTFLNEMLEISGGENIFKELDGWNHVNDESIISKNPEIIFTNVNMEGITDSIKNRPGFENIDAVKNNRVYYIDENASSRPSGNFIKALKQMSEYIRDK